MAAREGQLHVTKWAVEQGLAINANEVLDALKDAYPRKERGYWHFLWK